MAQTEQSYYISAKLLNAVLNHLTGMVLEAYKDNEHANVFYTKALEYLK